MKRPTGLTIIAILAGLGGLLNLVGGIQLLGLNASLYTAGGLIPLLGFAGVALGIVGLVFAYGAWILRPWAWMLGVALCVASIVVDLFIMVEFKTSTGIVNVIFCGIIIYYLWLPNTRRVLGHS